MLGLAVVIRCVYFGVHGGSVGHLTVHLLLPILAAATIFTVVLRKAPAEYTALGVLFGVVLAQQLVGLVGESIIWLRLAGAGVADGAMAAGIVKFFAFDAAGFVMMAVAFALMQRVWRAGATNRNLAG